MKLKRNLIADKSGNLFSILKKTKTFSHCSEIDLKIITDSCVEKFYPAKQIIFNKDDTSDGFYVIHMGKIEIISHSYEGKEIILNFLAEGDSFGEIGFLDRTPRTATVRAKTDVKCIFLSLSDFDNFSNDLSKDFWIGIAQTLCGLIRKKSNYIEDMHFLSAKERLADQLLQLGSYDKLYKGGQITLYISQEKLAQTLGLTREITNKLLANLEEQGLVQLERGKITLCNPEVLAVMKGFYI